MTDPIVAFIRTQLDQLERNLIRYRNGHDGPCVNYDGQDPSGYDQWDSCSRHIATAEATPYRDADFGLRQVPLLRRIVERHEPSHTPGPDEDPAYCMGCDNISPCPDLRNLATMFEGVDGWNPNWMVKS